MTVDKPNPAELDLTNIEWVTASGGGGNCVLLGRQGEFILVGDSKNPDRLPQIYTLDEARTWVQGAKDGVFDALLCP
ncbi:DUF397 domain-containing protein [Streptomyces sp. NPDC001407]|uniref:DUF397 domain-containing protein n=1 Tax=Streptomyces sp. NPDC001407 TaxID=3364573 RepID=UPI003676ACF2